jgi:hypothetical protein
MVRRAHQLLSFGILCWNILNRRVSRRPRKAGPITACHVMFVFAVMNNELPDMHALAHVLALRTTLDVLKDGTGVVRCRSLIRMVLSSVPDQVYTQTIYVID